MTAFWDFIFVRVRSQDGAAHRSSQCKHEISTLSLQSWTSRSITCRRSSFTISQGSRVATGAFRIPRLHPPRTPLSFRSRSGWETAPTLRLANPLATTHIAASVLGTLATEAVGELIVRRRYLLLKKAGTNTDDLFIGRILAGLNTLLRKKAEFPAIRRSQ